MNLRVFGSAAVSALVVGATLGACHFGIKGVLIPLADDAGVEDLGGDGPEVELGPPDLSGLCNGGPTSACTADGQTLLGCTGNMMTSTSCPDGCSSTPAPHCEHLDPSGVPSSDDYLQPAGLGDVELSGPIFIHGDTGEIDASPTGRGAGAGVIDTISYELVPQTGGPSVAVFAFKSLTIATGATVSVIGPNPIALIADGDITVSGAIDVQGSCMPGSPIASGGTGGVAAMTTGGDGTGYGKGKGGGSNGAGGGGGGGGAYGETGGKGAGNTMMTNIGGAGGMLQGDLSQPNPILIGGSGGGAGGGMGGMATGGTGGNGGGFLQLSSNHQISLGSASAINAGGCHGAPSAGNGGGGGGGSGGGIIIEARTLQVATGAILLANGGAGAGGGPGGMPGEDGHNEDDDHASGGNAGTKGTDGGSGGHTGHLNGGDASAPSGGDNFGGGGGGAVGRIAIKVKSGNPALSGAVMSPQIGEKIGSDIPPATLGAPLFD